MRTYSCQRRAKEETEQIVFPAANVSSGGNGEKSRRLAFRRRAMSAPLLARSFRAARYGRIKIRRWPTSAEARTRPQQEFVGPRSRRSTSRFSGGARATSAETGGWAATYCTNVGVQSRLPDEHFTSPARCPVGSNCHCRPEVRMALQSSASRGASPGTCCR